MKKETKNILWVIVIFIIIVGTLIFVNKDSNVATSSYIEYSASVLSATEDRFDFNLISMKDGNVTHQFEIRNDGKETVIIKKVYTSCMCTTALIIDSFNKKYGAFGMQGHGISSKTNIEINAGESAFVEAIFDPAAHGPSGVGLVRRSIYIETNSAQSPKLELSFQAMVTR